MSKQGVEIAIYSGLVTVGAAAGFIGGYFYSKKKWRAIADEEIFEVKKTYHEARMRETVSLEDLQKRYHPDRVEDHEVKPMSPAALKNTLGYVPGEDEPKVPDRSFIVDPAVVTAQDVLGKPLEVQVDEEPSSNVFDTHGDEQYFEPTDERPYLVSEEIYHSSFNDNKERVTLVYYEGDEALTDEGDNLVDNISQVVGEQALHMFGVRSNDPDIVYVMNEGFGALYEIVRKPGTYAEVINANPQE